MKHCLRKSIFTVLLIISFCVFSKIYYLHRIDLGKIKWIDCSDNLSKLMVQDSCLLGPCSISLWARYPYIYGRFRNDNELYAEYFIIDLREKEIKIQKIDRVNVPYEFEKRKLDYSEITTFWSLKGQWGNKDRLKSLIENTKEQ